MSSIPHMNVVHIDVGKLRASHQNPRTHSLKQLQLIADSIIEFGFTNPILVDEAYTVLAGHGRLEAAKLLGLESVPTLRIDHMTEAQKRAYVITDNRVAELAGWDADLLALEFKHIVELNTDFDLTITGFETAEIDLIVEGPPDDEITDPADQVRAYDEAAPEISQIGDLWQLGRHRLLCGDATAADSYSALLDGACAQMVFIDPPYNVRINGHVIGSSSARHDEFPMASGEMNEAAYMAFLRKTFEQLCAHSADGSIHYVCIDWRHVHELLCAGREIFTEVKNLCVWNKSNAGQGSFYRSKHELVFVFKNGTAPHINNFELGQHGRYRTNVWDYAGVNTLGADRLATLQMHPTVKPVAMVADAIKDCSKRGGIILDTFAGSGTTIIAAERTGRLARAIELAPRYVDTAVRRWQEFTGEDAVLVANGHSFEQVADDRIAGCGSESPIDD